MKKLFFSFWMVFICLVSMSQGDTMFLQKNKKITCKIYEINEYEIKYKRAEALDGPIYSVDKSNVIKYCLANGFCELLTPDELSLENQHKEILGNRQVVKIHPFSSAGSHIGFAYEKVIKIGMNLDIEAGYINSNINPYVNIFGGGYYGNIFQYGFYLKPGVKFFLGQDFYIKGLKYAHPLKGRYIKLDLAISNVNYDNIAFTNYNGTTYPYVPTPPLYTDINTLAYGGFVNYGRQFILGNILTMDYYIGVGFTGQSIAYSNPAYTSSGYYGYYYFNENSTANYHSFWRIPKVGMSFTAGFRIGYIIPEAKNKSKNHKPTAAN
ncbi:MAG: hypothetical protein SFY56_05650 [Bacteroidota bacterium]|nr:hypothetical protein [Bacteroidota bacterium]